MGVSGQHLAPAALPPGKTRYPLYWRLGGPQGRPGRMRKISPPPHTGIRSPDRPSRSESLYRLSYRCHINAIGAFINAVTAVFISFTFIHCHPVILRHIAKAVDEVPWNETKSKLNRSFPPLKPTQQPVPVAAQSKAWVCGRSTVGLGEIQSCRGHWCLSKSVVCSQAEVSATRRSLVQRSPTKCDRESSTMRSTRAVQP